MPDMNDAPDLGQEEDNDGFCVGESGFVELMMDIQELVARGYGFVDIMLSLGERYDRTKVKAVLEEARKQGIL